MAREFVRAFSEPRPASIINIASISGKVGFVYDFTTHNYPTVYIKYPKYICFSCHLTLAYLNLNSDPSDYLITSLNMQ